MYTCVYCLYITGCSHFVFHCVCCMFCVFSRFVCVVVSFVAIGVELFTVGFRVNGLVFIYLSALRGFNGLSVGRAL